MSLNNRDCTNGQLVVLAENCQNLTNQLLSAINSGTLSDKAYRNLNEARILLQKTYRHIDDGRGWNLPGIYDDTKEG